MVVIRSSVMYCPTRPSPMPTRVSMISQDVFPKTGKIRSSDRLIVPKIPPTCMVLQSRSSRLPHTSHETRRRGPGTLLKATKVVWPVAMAWRPSSLCTGTLTAQLRRMSQSTTKPTSAPSRVVAMSSPEPTMEPVNSRPGPSWRIVDQRSAGGFLTCSGSSA